MSLNIRNAPDSIWLLLNIVKQADGTRGGLFVYFAYFHVPTTEKLAVKFYLCEVQLIFCEFLWEFVLGKWCQNKTNKKEKLDEILKGFKKSKIIENIKNLNFGIRTVKRKKKFEEVGSRYLFFIFKDSNLIFNIIFNS